MTANHLLEYLICAIHFLVFVVGGGGGGGEGMILEYARRDLVLCNSRIIHVGIDSFQLVPSYSSRNLM